MHNGEVMRKLIPATERGTMGRTFLTGDAAFKAPERAGSGAKHHWIPWSPWRAHDMYEIASGDTYWFEFARIVAFLPFPAYDQCLVFSFFAPQCSLHQHLELILSGQLWKVTVWDIETGAQKKVFNCHSHVLVLAVSPFLGLIAAGEVLVGGKRLQGFGCSFVVIEGTIPTFHPKVGRSPFSFPLALKANGRVTLWDAEVEKLW